MIRNTEVVQETNRDTGGEASIGGFDSCQNGTCTINIHCLKINITSAKKYIKHIFIQPTRACPHRIVIVNRKSKSIRFQECFPRGVQQE